MSKILICGLGAIGSNLLLGLARIFPDNEYHGLDYDKVENRNLLTQAYFHEHINLKKVLAMRVVLGRYVPKTRYIPIDRKLDTDVNTLGSYDLIIDCFDNSQSRTLVNGSNVLHLGFSPHLTAEFIWDTDYSVPGDVDPTRPDICSQIAALPFIHSFVNHSLYALVEYFTQHKKPWFLQQGISVTYLRDQ